MHDHKSFFKVALLLLLLSNFDVNSSQLSAWESVYIVIYKP